MTSRSRRVVVFGTFDARRHPRVSVLEEGLRSAGHEVRRCNVPWEATTAERVASLTNPVVTLRLGWRLLRSWTRLLRQARQLSHVEVVLVGYLGVLDVRLARWCWPEALIILDQLAPVGGIVEDRLTSRWRMRVGQWLDRTARQHADVVVVDTEEHRGPASDVIVPVGAPVGWFSARQSCPTISDLASRPLRVVFFGLFTPLQGAVTIARALRSVLEEGHELEVTLVGAGQDLAAARAVLAGAASVRWFDWVEPEELPDLVAAHDVCVGIMGTTPKAMRVVPNKVYQGAAAGCAIITSDTPPQRRALMEVAMLAPPGDVGALASILSELAADPLVVQRARLAAADWADGSARPDKVVAPLLTVLDGVDRSS